MGRAGSAADPSRVNENVLFEERYCGKSPSSQPANRSRFLSKSPIVRIYRLRMLAPGAVAGEKLFLARPDASRSFS
jgi:hypothetical protein